MDTLLEACKNGDLQKVKELMTSNEQKIFGETITKCVSVALENGHINIFRYLVKTKDMYATCCDSSKFFSYVMIKGVSNPDWY